MSEISILIVALLLDAALGEPDWVWKRVPHPAVIMGKIIGTLDKTFNVGENRFAKGALVIIMLCGLTGLAAWAFSCLPGAPLFECIIVAILLAQKSLCQHVQNVADTLRQSPEHARKSVAMIVGRDSSKMDSSAIARSAIESGAENFSDGVVAPVFWYLIGGLPGIIIYKLVNTADSMIGYRTPHHEAFGKCAARLDDVMNWIPARLSAVLLLAARWPRWQRWQRGVWQTMRRDAPLHRSPNAGWPEAAMAVTLNIALSGPRSYNGEMRDYPWVNDAGSHIIGAREIDQAVDVLWAAWFSLIMGLFLLRLVT